MRKPDLTEVNNKMAAIVDGKWHHGLLKRHHAPEKSPKSITPAQ